MVASLPQFPAQISPTEETLSQFVAQWLHGYQTRIKAIDLFNPALSKTLSHEQQQFFVKAFYHVRGHCNDFFWFVANHGTFEMKELILDNTAEEFGAKGRSHEQLYYEFAEALGVNITDEVVNETTHLPFVREYNREHLHWLATHTADSLISAFSAYEKLDNPDYNSLYDLVSSFGISGRGTLFFDVHRHVEHYEATSHFIETIWNENPEIVKEAFAFIGEHQLEMWQQLSNAVFSYQP